MFARCARPNRFDLFGFVLLSSLLIIPFGVMAQQPTPPEGQTTPPAAQAPPVVPAQPAAAQESEGPQTLHLLVGRSLVISSPTRIKRISLADPNIAEAIVVSPTQVLVNGKTPGGVSLLLWDEADQSQAFEVSVDIDVLGLSQKIHEVFPSEDVHIETSKDVIMLSGKISSAAVADKILEVVKNSSPKVTSLMEVPVAPMGQIMLQVRFAEVDRTAINQLGINLLSLPGAKNIGTISTQQFAPPQLANQSSGTASNIALSDLLNIFIFLAGGEFPFPVVQPSQGFTAVTITFKEFGVRLNFTPTLTPDGLIHLKVKPEVSSLDFTNALTISGFLIPALSTRRVESEMDLSDGQSFAIAGLVDNRVTEQFQKIPGIGDIPILGKLFQSRTLNKSKSELLIVVTPRIVKPVSADKTPKGPAFPVPFLEPTTPSAGQSPSTPK
jgi:pilus assembly protein CpaC